MHENRQPQGSVKNPPAAAGDLPRVPVRPRFLAGKDPLGVYKALALAWELSARQKAIAYGLMAFARADAGGVAGCGDEMLRGCAALTGEELDAELLAFSELPSPPVIGDGAAFRVVWEALGAASTRTYQQLRRRASVINSDTNRTPGVVRNGGGVRRLKAQKGVCKAWELTWRQKLLLHVLLVFADDEGWLHSEPELLAACTSLPVDVVCTELAEISRTTKALELMSSSERDDVPELRLDWAQFAVWEQRSFHEVRYRPIRRCRIAEEAQAPLVSTRVPADPEFPAVVAQPVRAEAFEPEPVSEVAAPEKLSTRVAEPRRPPHRLPTPRHERAPSVPQPPATDDGPLHREWTALAFSSDPSAPRPPPLSDAIRERYRRLVDSGLSPRDAARRVLMTVDTSAPTVVTVKVSSPTSFARKAPAQKGVEEKPLEGTQAQEPPLVRPKRVRSAEEFMAFTQRELPESGPDPDEHLTPASLAFVAIARLIAERGLDPSWAQRLRNSAVWLIEQQGAAPAQAVEMAFRHEVRERREELLGEKNEGASRAMALAAPRLLAWGGIGASHSNPPQAHAQPPVNGVSRGSVRVDYLMRTTRMSRAEAMDAYLQEEARTREIARVPLPRPDAKQRVDDLMHERGLDFEEAFDLYWEEEAQEREQATQQDRVGPSQARAAVAA